MEFTVNKADLVRELNLSQGVVEKKATIPILSNILVEASEDRLTLTATDLELGIRSATAAKVKTAGVGTIPAKRLLDYVRLLPDSEIQIKFSDTHWASLTCGRSRSRIAGMSRESYPELPEMPEAATQISLPALTSLIQKTIFSISNEDSRFTLNGALLQVQDGGMTMVATDGHRLALAHQPGSASEAPPSKALLPRKAMVELLKIAAEVTGEDVKIDYAADDNHLFFRLGDRLLMSRKLTGNFPDYERVLPRSHAHSITMNREELRGTIERVAQFADERTRAIKVQLADNEAKVHSSLSETGESEESLGVEYIGPTVEIGFNAQYLLEFLRAVPEPEVSFHFKDGQSAGELRPAGDALAYEYRYVVMPMRI
jgi:DNA polymerase-3 subunit beta